MRAHHGGQRRASVAVEARPAGGAVVTRGRWIPPGKGYEAWREEQAALAAEPVDIGEMVARSIRTPQAAPLVPRLALPPGKGGGI